MVHKLSMEDFAPITGKSLQSKYNGNAHLKNSSLISNGEDYQP